MNKHRDTRAGRRRRTQIGGAFRAHLIEMVASPAWRKTSLSLRRVLDRLDLELAAHGGTGNGSLIVTYQQFVDHGIDRGAIGSAIREGVALGFLEITRQGRAGNAEFRMPSTYRLTYQFTDGASATHEWRKITDQEARAIATEARATKAFRKTKKQKTSREKPTDISRENPTENAQIHGGKTPTTAKVGKPTLLSISRAGDEQISSEAEAA